MTRRGLTERENTAFQFIRRELAAGRLPPTYQTLKDHLGLASKSGVCRLVQALTDKGYIVTVHGRHRCIALAPGADVYTVHLPPELDAQLTAHVSAWAASPQDVITKAVAEYLGRHA